MRLNMLREYYELAAKMPHMTQGDLSVAKDALGGHGLWMAYCRFHGHPV